MPGDAGRWDANQATRAAWNAGAQFWDERMGEGNDFVEVLIWPAVERMLAPRRGERILDVACGNGLTSRRLAAAGADVLAFDFSEAMIEHAIARTVCPRDGHGRVEYRVVDATDSDALLGLGVGEYDAALCNMALFDMADIRPLAASLPKLLRPGGRFVFSVLHPCFNSADVTHVAELEDREGDIVTTYSIKVRTYMSPSATRGAAIRGQPEPHIYFHRPLQDLLEPFLAAGFVVDGLEERAFPPDHPQGSTPLSWGGCFSEIPPVLVARLRLA
jgi:2-polyprenyl-3-methyl-5-hydroxy-6-metoxy-1,4-benzoquinol methylase